MMAQMIVETIQTKEDVVSFILKFILLLYLDRVFDTHVRVLLCAFDHDLASGYKLNQTLNPFFQCVFNHNNR